VVVAPLRGITAFASADELTAEQALNAPVRSWPRRRWWSDPVSVRGKKASAALATLGIATYGDLIEHLPHSHRDQRDLRRVADLAIGEDATVALTVRSIEVRSMRNRRQKFVRAHVFDETGPMVATWFNQPWVADRLHPGSAVLLHGRLRKGTDFQVKSWEAMTAGESPVHTFGLIPVHPASDGISAERLRSLAWEAYPRMLTAVDPRPARLRAAERLTDRPAALAAAHFPDNEEQEEGARHRLAFEELLLFQLAVTGRRRRRREGRRATPLAAVGGVSDGWREALPFELTGDQVSACAEIDADIARERPMQRLLMGEVGSGKTVVALHAMLRAVENGDQAVLMAPTETLAEQHHRTLDRLLGGATPVELLTGSTTAARRRDLLARLASGELGLLVGTHALIEEPVAFRSLALTVVDEQHRFGVRQRAALESKAPAGLVPHALHMTATPIPRTLSLTAYGDLDATALRELPRGRQPVETHVVDGERARRRAYERIREEIAAGRQCFVVCPLVEESEALQATAATAEFERLRTTEFREQRVALIHGQMPSKSKAAAMDAFAAGETDVLVATSVIEVGIDVPNATVMMIEAAERYGLSQLHQLRGRVGRGEHPSLCILVGDPRLRRLEAIAKERDGFRLAEVDLELRGAGDVLGTRQHGLPEFRVAQLPEDVELLGRARRHADAILARDPELSAPEHVLMREAVLARFGSELDPIQA
jgi:ATP-dependent DNA helicase RecG